MCSLFGWLDYKGIIPDKVLKRLTQSLANAARIGSANKKEA